MTDEVPVSEWITLDRAVEVLHDAGDGVSPRWTVGSGFLIGGRRVLTAAHNIGTGAVSIRVRGAAEHEARVIVRGGEENEPDLAILEVTVPGFERVVPPVRFAQVDRTNPAIVEGCWAVGFPAFKERLLSLGQTGQRDTAHLRGTIAPGANRVSGMLEMEVTASPRPLPRSDGGAARSEWQGISGAVVFCGVELGTLALGVVVEHFLPEGESSLTVEPITAVAESVDANRWWSLLGVNDPKGLPRVPSGPRHERSPYLEAIAEIARRTPVLLDREKDLESLVSFAQGGHGYLRMIGRAWSGKTALVSHLLQDLPPNVDVVSYFLSRRHQDADSIRFCSVVGDQLAHLVGENDAPPTITREALLLLWRRAVHRAEGLGRRLVLVVDGLDEDLYLQRGLPSVASLLPTLSGDGVCVLVISRPHRLPTDVDVEHPLLSLDTPVRTLDPTPHVRQMQARADQDLDVILDGAEPFPSPRETAQEVLSLLAAAEGPLSASDLASLTGSNGFEIDYVVKTQLTRVVDTLPGEERRFAFAHETLLERTYARSAEVGRLLPARQQIFSWAGRCAAAGWLAHPPSAYLVDSYPGLLGAHARGRLTDLLNRMDYLEAAVRAVGIDRVLGTLRAALADGNLDAQLPALRVLSLEAPHLRGWVPARYEPAFATQLRNRAMALGLDDLVEQLDARLSAIRQPHLRLRWRASGESSALEQTLLGHDSPARDVAVILDGRGLVSGGPDGSLCVWSVDSGQHSLLGDHPYGVLRLLASPDGTRAIALAAEKYSARIWDLERGRLLRVIPGASEIAMTRRGRLFFAASSTEVNVFAAATAQKVDGLTLEPEIATALAVDDDGSVVAVGRASGEVLVWRRESAETVRYRTAGEVSALAVSSRGAIVIIGTRDGVVEIWDSTTHADVRRLGSRKAPVARVLFSDDGMTAVSSYTDGAMTAWDVSEGTKLNSMAGEDRGGYGGVAGALALSRNGELAVGAVDTRVVVMETAPGGNVTILRGHAGRVHATALSPGGENAYSASEDGTVKVWNLTSARPETVLWGHEEEVGAIAIDSDARMAFSGAADGTLKAWDLANARERFAHDAHSGCYVSALAVDRERQVLVSVGLDTTMRFWSINSGRQRRWVDTPFLADAIGVRDDGTVILASHEGDVTSYRDGKFRMLNRGADKRGLVGPCCVAEDGSRVAFQPPEGTNGLTFFDVATRQQQLLPSEDVGGQLALTPDGRIAAVLTSGALWIELWDAVRGRRVGRLAGSGSGTGTESVVVTGEEGVVATCGRNRSVRAWFAGGTHRNADGAPPVAVWSWDEEGESIAASQDGSIIVTGMSTGAVLCLELWVPPAQPR